ncbi:MAG: CBS and ACT domain-containing protein [Bacillota bacterium]
MYVRVRMTPKPITVTRRTTIAEALDIMRSNNIRRLPVVEKSKLIGIVTDRDLREVSPSPATSLSIFEINYLLAKTRIGEIIPKSKKIITITPDAYLEEAALSMREHKIGALPVVEGDELVGIITETNIFDAFIDLMGLRDPGTRITLKVEDRPGVLADVTNVIKEYGLNITHIAVFGEGQEETNLVLRVNTFNADGVVATLKNHGYQIISVKSYDQFDPQVGSR